MSFTRVRAVVIVGVLALAAIVVVVVALVRDTQGDASAGRGCLDGAPVAAVALPAVPEQVKLRVRNGTRTAGVADRVTEEFKNRGFTMQPPKDGAKKIAGIAVIQYGPKSVGAAQWIRAYFLGDAKAEYNATRTTDVIDVVIGDQYRQLATRTEVNQSLAQLSEPTLPPGACASPRPSARGA